MSWLISDLHHSKYSLGSENNVAQSSQNVKIKSIHALQPPSTFKSILEKVALIANRCIGDN